MTTPKRNEAVAWRNRSKLPSHDEWSGWAIHTRFDLMKSTAHHYRRIGHEYEAEKLYPQSVVDALQGEVSRLRAKVEGARVLAQHWQGMAAESWGEDKRDAALQSCCDELLGTLNLEPPTDGR